MTVQTEESSSKATQEVARLKSLLDAAAKTLVAAVWDGIIDHFEGCPGDDTCECAHMLVISRLCEAAGLRHSFWVEHHGKHAALACNQVVIDKQMADHDHCALCGLAAIAMCRCFRGDRYCANGHHWHFCLEHRVAVLAESDHSNNDCSCPRS